VPLAADNHALRVVNAAQKLLLELELLNIKRQSLNKAIFSFRFGAHSGPLVAGVVGSKKFAYDIWGDTVNTAARIEQHGVVNRIQISDATYALVKDHLACEYRGEIEAKHKGKLHTYFVV
jgi:class 3 adenylate cyclase